MNAETIADKKLKLALDKYSKVDMFEGVSLTSPEVHGPDGDTPFHMSTFDGDLEAAKAMILYVLNIDIEGDNGNSPLHYAIIRKNKEMAKILISAGASLLKKNDYGDTPLDYIGDDESLQDLIRVQQDKKEL
ncbi:ankyrin repeat domain-containing protein [Comamonas sp. J-3]|uniref:ankyrin repeat domain-containing protein n=1 Tax=Comamonas trifloxystrobinivorans TaxID=3350256 RepID=UPI0037294A0B